MVIAATNEIVPTRERPIFVVDVPHYGMPHFVKHYIWTVLSSIRFQINMTKITEPNHRYVTATEEVIITTRIRIPLGEKVSLFIGKK